MSASLDSAVYESGTAPRLERTPVHALRVPPRVNAEAHPAPSRPDLMRGPLPGVLVEILLKTATDMGARETRSMHPAKRNASGRGTAAEKEPLSDQGFERAQRVAVGRVEADEVAWLKKGFSAFLAAGGALPLERCLGLPRNDCALRRTCRDYWLRRAWNALSEELSPWRRSERLAMLIRNFRTRYWGRWRLLDEPPKIASDVERSLFHAFRSSERVPQTAMQLHNIATHRRHS